MGGMPTWKEIIERNPQHSVQYAARWRRFQAEGRDIDGEARMIDAMAPRHARILDAGCGTGRVGGYLAAQGHHVTGTDVDDVLLEHARLDFPEATWKHVDLETHAQPEGPYDIIVLAGNVVGFIAPDRRSHMLSSLQEVLAPDGRLVVGYGAGRGWEFEDFLRAAEDAELHVDVLFSSWDLRPFTADADFLVAVLRGARD